MKCLFYAEEGATIGRGHRRRCEALLAALGERGWQCDFFSASADVSSSDCVVIDSYIMPPERIRDLRTQCGYLVGFHDLGEPDTNFSLLVSTVYREPMAVGATRILGGARYRIIHPEIRRRKRISVGARASRVVVTFGGSDANARRANEMTRALSVRFPDLRFDAVAGLPSAVAAELFSKADIAVSGGGQTMNELLCLGIPAIAVSLSEDQDAQIEEAVAAGAITRAGRVGDAEIIEKIAQAVSGLYSEAPRQALHRKAQEFIDGRGAERVAEAIEEALS